MAHASRVRTEKHGDATLRVREDLVLDTETGLMVKRETVMAEVPIEGGRAFFMSQSTEASVADTERKPPPAYTPRRNQVAPLRLPPIEPRPNTSSYNMNPPLSSAPPPPVQHREPGERVSVPHYSTSDCDCSDSVEFSHVGAVVMSCCAWIVGTTIIAGISFTDCPPLFGAESSCIAAGIAVILLGCLCVCCGFVYAESTNDCCTSTWQSVWCCLIWTIMVFFIAAVIASSAYVFSNFDFSSEDLVDCAVPALAFGLTILSYIMLVVFGILCFYSTYSCWTACATDG